jgi:phosphatidylglycerophosphate synthase
MNINDDKVFQEILSYNQKTTGHKIHDNLESPFTTSVLLNNCDEVADNFEQVSVHPNSITIFRAMLSLLAIYLVWIKKPKIAALFYFSNYFFDCMDGIVARKFDKCTVLGDTLDHIADVGAFFGIFVVIMIRYPMNKFWLIMIAVFFGGTLIHLGFVETYTTSCLNLDEPHNFLRYCLAASEWFQPNMEYSSGTKQKFCNNLISSMNYTRFATDVNIVLIICIYLLLQK